MKRGQVTVFMIIAIVIVAAAVVIFFVYPRVGPPSVISGTPTEFIQDCMGEEISDAVKEISFHGGSLEPEFYYEHFIDGEKYEIEYLCYTNLNIGDSSKPVCTIQQPTLMRHVGDEIKNAISAQTQKCFDSLEKHYKEKGYSVELKRNDYEVNLIPNRVVTTFDYGLTLTKGSASDRYNEFKVVLNNNLHGLVSIANRILNWETSYGDADVRDYMNSYHWLDAKKLKKTDGTTVYILTDKNSENKFMFASRSLAWP